MLQEVVDFIQELYQTKEFIALHKPRFAGNEKKYLDQCIDENAVSAHGSFVSRFENQVCEFTRAKYSVATVNGTAALHLALRLAGVGKGDLVITQPLTFVATCNVISYLGANPLFLDVDQHTLSLSHEKLKEFLSTECEVDDDNCIYKPSGQKISACVPMHTLGRPGKITELVELCNEHRIPLVEDSAESLGSFYHDQHVGTFGKMGVFSFNGNKTITAGGGGIITFHTEDLAEKARHLRSTAKLKHPYEYQYDSVGYNYQLPNLNAALAYAQMEQLPEILKVKREISRKYSAFFEGSHVEFLEEPKNTTCNHWLNAVKVVDRVFRDDFVAYLNKHQIEAKPIWNLMTDQPMYSGNIHGDISNAQLISKQIVMLPSGPVEMV